MMTPLAILVDLDGTLVDTALANYEAYAQSLAEVGVTISRERFDREVAGRNWKQFLPEMLARAGVQAEPRAVAARKTVIYAERLDRVIPNHALIALLRQLRATQCLAALVTSASAANARAVLRHLDLAGLFDTIVTGDDVSNHKPAPDSYQLAAQRLGVDPAQCIVIEDSDIGVASANAFGAPVLRVGAVSNWGAALQTH
jgi:beta-phosphoglucomutase